MAVLALNVVLAWLFTVSIGPVLSWAPPIARRGSSSSHHSASVRLNAAFDLDGYVSSELLTAISAPKVETVSQLGFVTQFDESSYSHVMLVDIGSRDLEGLRNNLNLPGVHQFVSKLEADKKGILDDKFMYSYDVGIGSECQMVLTRVPEKSYQKLDLAKEIMNVVKAPNVVVSTIDEFGDIIIDERMGAAIYSAWQSRDFSMPSWKTTGGGVQATVSSLKKKDKNRDQSRRFFLLEPTSHLDETSNQEPSQTSQTKDDTIDNLDDWHYFKDLTEEEKNDKRDKIRKLEAALLSSSSVVGQTFKPESTSPSEIKNQIFKKQQHTISVSAAAEKIMKLSHVNHGTNIARALSSLPPNVLNPSTYGKVIRAMAASMGWELTEWSTSELENIGCGGFCAVSRGNKVDTVTGDTSDRLFRLKYVPKPSSDDGAANSFNSAVNLGDILRQNGADTAAGSGIFETDDDKIKIKTPIVLVGKGVTYDTGGINLKPANSMRTMKGDMAGSAAALGVIHALTQLNVRVPVECWLGIVENNSGRDAFRPDDIVNVVTGESVEIVNTDAEGRLILSDILALASRKIRKSKVHGFSDTMSPRCVIDFATLTGTCISSLSTRYVGVMTNRDDSMVDILTSSEACGERMWPFPVDDDFGDDLKSDIADYLQCRQPVEADHIYAAYFLKQFMNPAVPWFHFDMASSYRAGGLGHVGTDFTGCGVRSSISLLEHYL
jgi:leucyl aminopeptidase